MQKKVKLTSFDGTILNGILEVPDNQEIKGGVLLLHGCISEKNEDGFHSEQPSPDSNFKKIGGMAEYLSHYGYMSLRFDYREQGENEKTENMKNLSISGMISDTDSGYCELKNQLPKSKPISVVGTSFAGGVSVKWVNAYGRKINNLFLMAPLLDFPYTIRKTKVTTVDDRGYELLTDDAVRLLTETGYLISGNKKMSREFINEVMMMNMEKEFKAIKCNVFIFHGDADTVVPYESSIKFSKLKSAKCRLFPIKNAVHGFGLEGDTDWETDETKSNHETIYTTMIKIMNNDY